jgi:hypothetical protein
MPQDLREKALSIQEPQSTANSPSDEARELIARYPNLSEAELVRLISQYRDLSALDMALMLSDDNLAPKLDRFSSDHRSRTRTPFRHYAALLAYAAVAVGMVAWAGTRFS